jgi:hypothetical protein
VNGRRLRIFADKIIASAANTGVPARDIEPARSFIKKRGKKVRLSPV